MGDMLVKSESLAAVADAIRTKGGTSDALTFPGGFVDAVGAIQAGSGGGSGDEQFAAFVSDTLVDAVIPDTVTTLSQYTFYLKKALKSITAPSVTTTKGYVFREATALETVNMPRLRTIGGRDFYGCTSLKKISLPELGPLYSAQPSMFQGCTNLEFADLGRCNALAAQTFQGCAKLTTLVLRSTNVNNAAVRVLCPLNNVNAFTGTPFASDGTGGKIYVYQEFVEKYKTATNWSTLFNTGNVEFLPIEGSDYE